MRATVEQEDGSAAAGPPAPLKPARGFPTTSYNLGEWLYLQCT
ncbi:hypothetical protein ACGFZB_41255 [Streptomyces cinerochromogenes]|uniref:Uncharacterized protein n=1 Tax=Streptomyces cinerochromogenes TaxID=66422 RepID=A0ABW7BLH2_9ACTN